ncbi:MAG: HAD-IA family hydrolase [Psychrosphaera sp.]|nr:HAD-IA family hydrolase [Psychrosphaera sp.]
MTTNKGQAPLPLINHIDGIIFDMDGTLVDSSLDFVLMRQQVGCPQDVDMLKFIDAINDPVERQRCADLVIEHELQDARQSRWLPGAQQLMQQLHQHQIPQAIVTRNSAQACQIKISNNQIPVTLAITRENHRPKPAPDALLAVAQQWDIAPQRLMYVGDYLYDVQAGNNAGMMSCLITHERDLAYSSDADIVFEQMDGLIAAFFG